MQKYFYVYVQKMFCQKEKFAVFFLPDDDLICQKLGKYLAKKIKRMPKIKCMLITRPIWKQWKFTALNHRSFAN